MLQVASVGVHGVEAVPWMLQILVTAEIWEVAAPDVTAVVHHLMVLLGQVLGRASIEMVHVLITLHLRWSLA